MTALETVALDQRRWSVTALKLKNSNWARFRLMAALTFAGAILEAIALQIHIAHPATSQVTGYAGAVVWVLMLVVRAKGLRRERANAWVFAAAAAQTLKSEMYFYRTACGRYSNRLAGNPESTLLRRRDAIFEKVKAIQQYVVEPDSKPAAPLGPLDAEGYVIERVNDQIAMFQKFSKDLPEIQAEWLRMEYALAGIAALAALILIFTRNQAYCAWVIIIAFLSVMLGASTKLERYATLTVELRSMPDRLTHMLERWRSTDGTLEQLVYQIEAAVLAEGEAWVAFPDDDVLDASDSSRSDHSLLDPALQSPASRAGA